MVISMILPALASASVALACSPKFKPGDIVKVKTQDSCVGLVEQINICSESGTVYKVLIQCSNPKEFKHEDVNEDNMVKDK